MKPNVTEAVKTLLKFPFQDPKWGTKLLIGAVLVFANAIIPLLPAILLTGYIARLMRSTARGNDPALPEWDDWGGLLRDGFRLWAASFLYALPLVAMMLFSIGFIYGPMFLMPILEMEGTSPDGGFVALLILWELGIFFFIGISMLLVAVYAVVLPPMMVHTAERNEFSAAFKIGEWWGILRRNLAGFLAAAILTVGIYSALIFGVQLLYMTIFLCLFIPLLISPVVFYLCLTSSVAFAQAYQAGSPASLPVESAEAAQPTESRLEDSQPPVE